MINSRAKGAAAERELFNLLHEYIGILCKRNLTQTREGGSDCLSVPGWSFEVKRCEYEDIKAWWSQTVGAAKVQGRKPMLWWRQNRKPWRAVVDLHDLRPDVYPVEHREFAIISFDAACQLIREHLNMAPPNPYPFPAASVQRITANHC